MNMIKSYKLTKKSRFCKTTKFIKFSLKTPILATQGIYKGQTQIHEKHQKQPKMSQKHENHQNVEKHEKRPKMTKKHQKRPKK